MTGGPAPGGRTITALRLGETVVPVRVVRSALRHKTVSFAVQDGVVLVRAPLGVPVRELETMLKSRAAWLAARLASPPPEPATLADGQVIRYLGRDLALQVRAAAGKRGRVEVDGDTLRVDLPLDAQPGALQHAVEHWLQARAVEHLSAHVRRWSAASGLVPRRVIVKEQRRRWGSCSADGTLRLNWRLVNMAPEIAEYVVVHELAHLHERSHNTRFWAEVERLMPDFRDRRDQLRAEERAIG